MGMEIEVLKEGINGIVDTFMDNPRPNKSEKSSN